MKNNISNLVSENQNVLNIKDGVVYTPNFIVKNMLDIISYKGKSILKKHVIDNSCGEGTFLIEIVTRYIYIYM
jgi:adenine-specific DNA-methyltransferase